MGLLPEHKHMTLDNLLKALALQGTDRMTVDEMDHSGGAGISFVERWQLVSPTTAEDDDVWLWRVMWIPRRERGPRWKHQYRPVLIAHGISQDGQPGAQKAGRKAATRLAKERRAHVKTEINRVNTEMVTS